MSQKSPHFGVSTWVRDAAVLIGTVSIPGQLVAPYFGCSVPWHVTASISVYGIVSIAYAFGHRIDGLGACVRLICSTFLGKAGVSTDHGDRTMPKGGS